MPDRYVEDAMRRSEEAMVVLDRHRSALFPHIAVLLKTFGPALTRSIVSGAVEAVIQAAANGEPSTVLPFPEDRHG
jgi:hypothetical protein